MEMDSFRSLCNGPLARCVKLWVAHAPEMPGTFFPHHRLQRKPLVNDPGMHHGTCVTPWCMSGSLTCGGGKTFPEFPAHAHPQFYVSGKSPIEALVLCSIYSLLTAMLLFLSCEWNKFTYPSVIIQHFSYEKRKAHKDKIPRSAVFCLYRLNYFPPWVAQTPCSHETLTC